MLHKIGTFAGRKITPTGPTVMTDEQKSTYLSNLRNSRPARPSGSRPLPSRPSSHGLSNQSSPLVYPDSTSLNHPPDVTYLSTVTESSLPRPTSIPAASSIKGRPLVVAPDLAIPSVRGRKILPSATIQQPNLSSNEPGAISTTRLFEREEAQTLRKALEIIDQRDEEKKLYDAAQQEAADLVWKHRYPQAAENEKIAPYRNPDIEAKRSQTSIRESGNSHNFRSVSDSSTSTQTSRADVDSTTSKRRSRLKDKRLSDALKDLQMASQERTSEILAVAKSRRVSSGNRQVSNGSAKGIFRNPEDQIYEEPEDNSAGIGGTHHHTKGLPLSPRARNSLLRGSRPLPEKAINGSTTNRTRFDRFEIQRNPPTQSRNAAYTANLSTPAPKVEVIEEVDSPRSSTLEIRGDDIRAATTMKRKDRSPKLPTPSAVSDNLGRPIVSFDPTWRPAEMIRESQDLERPVVKVSEPPRIHVDSERPLPRPLSSKDEVIRSAPSVPTINLPEDGDVPQICIADSDSPSITVSQPSIPVVNVSMNSKPSPRPLPHHSQSSPSKIPLAKSDRFSWLHSAPRGMPTVTCSSCALPIAGRVVTASGSSSQTLKARLHPECFTCHHCSTPLECVSFYPEPDNKRAERLEAEGIAPDSPEADLRFYCHLDFHEFFSPRCRSCKTPIEGEVIIAAGGEWHVGHFFCGECGNPFDSNTPFVEKDGYAYCVTCHTRRTSARCKECKKQILDELTVEALGGKWHEQCFVCYECGDGFGDEGRFFVRDIEIEPTEKERRRGISRKMEERAVCAACEERRLKA